MFFENTIFFYFKNGKLSSRFYLSNVFSFFFFFQRSKNCFQKQLPNKVTISQILFQKYSIQHDSEHHCHVLHTQQDKF